MIIEERRNLLMIKISHWVNKGFHVISQTDTTAQLQLDKCFSWVLAAVLLLLGFLPGIVYIMTSKDKYVYIAVDESGAASVKMDWKEYGYLGWAIVIIAVIVMVSLLIYWWQATA